MTDYPNDSDGDARRGVAAHRNDMSPPMTIDFPVLFANEKNAKAFTPMAIDLGYRVRLYQHEDDSNWDVICTRDMVPVYDELVRIQDELTTAARPFGGHSDGWGTFGNKEED